MKKIVVLIVAMLVGFAGFAAEKMSDTQKAMLYVKYTYSNLAKWQPRKNLQVFDKNCMIDGKENLYKMNLGLAWIAEGLEEKDLVKLIEGVALSANQQISAADKKKIAAQKGTEKEKAFFAQTSAGIKKYQKEFEEEYKGIKFIDVKKSGNTYYVVTTYKNALRIHTVLQTGNLFKITSVNNVSKEAWKQLQPATFATIKKYLTPKKNNNNPESDLEDIEDIDL